MEYEGGCETIVVDDGSRDGTSGMVEEFHGVQLIMTGPGGPSRARNIAVSKARGSLVAFTDADCVVDPQWLGELVRCFHGEHIAGVGGAQECPSQESEFGKKVERFLASLAFLNGYKKSGTSAKETGHNPSCNVAYRKEVFKAVGGFEEGLWPGEDVELDYRIRKAGYSILYNPHAKVFHSRPGNLSAFARKIFSYGKTSGGYLTRKYGLYRALSWEPLILFFILILLGAGAAVFPLLFLWIAAGWVLLFWLILSGYHGGFREGCSQMILFSTAFFSWNAGFLAGFFRK